jgi:ribosomal protein S18 acetylase RimI-like enzyme
MELRQRAATPDDQTLSRRIHHLAYHDVVERQFGQWDDSQQDAYFDRSWQQHSHEILEWGHSTCGYFSVEIGPETVYIHELVLHPEYQNQGIGTQVLLGTIDEARRLGLDVRLQVLHENRRAADLYERLGFQETGTTTTHREMRLNT